MEIRLPWLLLNVESCFMSVHRDYYVYYGVEFRTVREIGIGMARETEMARFPWDPSRLKGWTGLEYREPEGQLLYHEDYWRGTD